LLPGVWLRDACARTAAADPNRKILVVIQCTGGNDGLNTVVPYTDARYRSLRPTLAFKDSTLKDAQGNSTIISNEFGLHPSLAPLKGLYDAGDMALILGVGYEKPNLSHFTSMDIWHTANPVDGRGKGWLGKYADLALAGKEGMTAISATFRLPKTLKADKVVIPNLQAATVDSYGVQLDARFPADRDRRLNLITANANRSFSDGSFIFEVARTGLGALSNVQRIRSAVSSYTSPVTYPPNSVFASSLKLVAQLVTSIPEANLLYVTLSDFDHHARQIDLHGELLRQFAEGVKAFYDDMIAHDLADNVLLMQWSEFGRRPDENGSLGTDHGSSSTMFVIGRPVRGSLYGEQPSLEATALDEAGNPKHTLDFRAVYGTLIEKWLEFDSAALLGERFEDVGFL
jgi:uncharacterized protein (DUF1501 family)